MYLEVLYNTYYTYVIENHKILNYIVLNEHGFVEQ